MLLGYRIPSLPTRLAAPWWGCCCAPASGETCWTPALQRAMANGGLQLGCVVGHTGYVGIPVALALLPPQALGYSITYDLVGTLITWSVGPLLIGGLAVTPSKLLPIFLGSPALQGVAIALAIHFTPWGEAVAALLWIPSRLVVSQLLRLPELVRSAVVLQAAAPTAISLLLIAEASGLHQERAAHLVLWRTLLALLSVPLWRWPGRHVDGECRSTSAGCKHLDLNRLLASWGIDEHGYWHLQTVDCCFD